MSARLRETKAMNAKNAEILRGLLKLPDNRLCVDCKRNDARWASTNLGIFLCIRCSGIHRGLGVHISRVRSVDLDTWSPEQIANMQRWGNAKANLYWEAHLKEGHQPPEHKIEQFIRSKYESKRWAMEGPMPDPDTLSVAGSSPLAAQATSPTPEAAAAPKTKSSTTSKPSAIDLLGGAFGDTGSSPQVSNKASPSVAYSSPPSSRTSSLPSAAASYGQTRTQQPAHTPSAAAAAPPAQSNASGLFDLDFNAPPAPSTNNATTNRKNANDIMSLFGSSSSVASPQQQPIATSNSNGLDAFASLNLGGAGASSWATPSTTNSTSAAPSHQYSSQSSYGQTSTRPASSSISGGNPWAAPATSDSAASRNGQTSNNLYSSPPAVNTASKPPAYANSMSNDFFSTPVSSNNFTSPGKSAALSTNNSSNMHNSMDFFNSQDIWGAPASNNKSSANDAFGGFSSGSSGKNTGGGFDDLWN